MSFRPRFMATHGPQMPKGDVEQTVRTIVKYFPEAPCLPSFYQSMRMFLDGMPCATINKERGKLIFDLSPEREGELLEFYERVLADDVDYFAISEKYMSTYSALLQFLKENRPPELKVVHFQMGGPVTFAMNSEDSAGMTAFHNETTRDIVVKLLAMKTKWVERLVRQTLPGVETLMEFGEPVLVVHTSAVGSGSEEDLIKAMDEVLEAVEGIRGIHCCANIDWPMLMRTKTACINFDSYEYADRVALYPDDLKRFLDRGGMLAWGCVPVSDERLAAETVDSLIERLEYGISLMVKRGIDEQLLAEASWVTPSCETIRMSPPMAERALAYTSEISRRMREKYFG